MESKSIKLIVFAVLFLLLANSVLSVVMDDTTALQQLNERLEKNKAEILKAIRDSQIQSLNTTSNFIDENFMVLDGNIQKKLDSSKRDIALIMVAGFLVGFVLSQIIRISIERAKRKATIKRGIELEVIVQKLVKEASELTTKVKQLKALDHQYSQDLKKMTRKEPIISLKMVLFGVITLLLGVIITYFVMGVK